MNFSSGFSFLLVLTGSRSGQGKKRPRHFSRMRGKATNNTHAYKTTIQQIKSPHRNLHTHARIHRFSPSSLIPSTPHFKSHQNQTLPISRNLSPLILKPILIIPLLAPNPHHNIRDNANGHIEHNECRHRCTYYPDSISKANTVPSPEDHY